MGRFSNHRDQRRARVFNALALLVLLGLGSLALFGPAGVIALGKDAALLEQHRARIAALEQRSAVLKNRVRLLDPDHVDVDLASELVRGNLNVAHPDEYVIDLSH